MAQLATPPRQPQASLPPGRMPARRSAPEVSARDLLEAIPDAVVGVDGEGLIAFVNLQAERTFGYERTELLGQRIELLVPGRWRDDHGRHRAGYHANPATRPMGAGLGLMARRRDGSEFPVEISLSPIRTVDGVQTIAAVRDVTRRHEMEQERARAEGLRTDLINMVVHDLKSPVNGIAMTAELLLRRGQLTEAQRSLVARVGRTCGDLLRLIANVLEIAKLEAEEMPVTTEPIVLAQLAAELVADYGPIADEGGRRLACEVGTDLPPALADRRLLQRVLVNLVANAFRHSGGAEVRIDALVAGDGSRVAIRVADDGHGIAEADQARIFEKFRTLPGDPSADTGLGLPFCRLAVERMRGTIAVTSAPGAGTTFTVTLPCAC